MANNGNCTGLANPVAPFLLSIAIYALSVAFYRQRWLLLAPLLYCDYLALRGSSHLPSNGLDSLWGLLVCIWASHSLSVLFLEDHTFLVDGKGVFEKQNWRWKFWATWNNPRLLFTSRTENRTPTTVKESRLAFAVRRSVKLVIYWMFNQHVQQLLLPGLFVPLYPADFDRTRQTYFRRILFDIHNPISIRETYMRSVFAVFWAAGAYALVDGAHTALSLVFVVVLRANLPEEWPAIYGSIRHAHSLRAFWGKFWHRLVVIPYGNVGKLLAIRCLGFQKGSLPYKTIVAISIFTLSGAAHAAVSWHLGDRKWWHLDILWFVLNFLASAAESFLCYTFSQQFGTVDYRRSPKAALLGTIARQCLGYVWVFLFFFWSVPKWQYPKLYSAIMGLSNAGETGI